MVIAMSLELLRESSAENAPPLLCLEVNPPRGVELEPVFQRLENRITGLDFFNVTDSALARMKLAAVPFGGLLKQRFGIEPLVNFSCRDRNLIAIQGDLLAAWVLGVRSIVALTGDAVSIGDMPESKGVFEVNSIGLLNCIKRLNEGCDLAGNALKGAPGLLPGVVLNPNVKNSAPELKRLKRKAEAGAVYALSQPSYDSKGSVEFFKNAQSSGVTVLMGLLPLKHPRSLEAISKIPGLKLSEEILSVMTRPPDEDVSTYFIDHCINLARLNRPYVRGFHVVSGASPGLSLELLQELVKVYKS